MKTPEITDEEILAAKRFVEAEFCHCSAADIQRMVELDLAISSERYRDAQKRRHDTDGEE